MLKRDDLKLIYKKWEKSVNVIKTKKKNFLKNEKTIIKIIYKNNI